jgi:hypothetical protein
MHERGIKLVANGLMSKFIIDEIEHKGPTKHLPTSL